MNYLIFDTEQTYNYGYIVVNETGEILLKENLILTNNFENRKLIGENTYKRKKPIYEKDPCAKFVSSADGAKIIADRLVQYQINQIISHNISEDRRQLELLNQQTGIAFPDIPFYDSINLVKVLFPNNTQTGLEAIISDISGIDIKQTHTALQDCELLYNLISPIIKYMPCFIQYKDIFAHDSNYEITKIFFMNFNSISPLPKTFEEIQEILNLTATGEKRTINNFLKDTAKTFNLWEVENYTKYGKNGNALKTPGERINYSNNINKREDLNLIAALFINLDKIADAIITACVKYQASQETDEIIIEKLNAYKAIFDAEFAERELAFKEMCAKKEAEFAEREAKMQTTIANIIMKKIRPIAIGGLFNSESKIVKQYVKENNKTALYNYFLKP